MQAIILYLFNQSNTEKEELIEEIKKVSGDCPSGGRLYGA